MRIDWWTLALQTVNVLVLVWLLSRFLYRPVMSAITTRQSAADKMLADAKKAREQAQSDLAAVESKTRAATADADATKAKALEAAAAERQTLLAEAAAACEALRETTEADLAAERAASAAALRAQAAQLAAVMARKLLGELPSGTADSALFQGLIEIVQALPEADRREAGKGVFELVGVGAQGAEVEAERRTALQKALGAQAEIRFRSDGALIAGFELHGPGLLVSNTWRADLDRMVLAIEPPVAPAVPDAA